ncbi:D-alanine--D-alanine ligase [Polaribacter dokdonensis]
MLHKSDNSIQKTLEKLKDSAITYPLIVKPDIGFRGLLVEKIKDQKALINYIQKYDINIIIQEYINYNNECGIFYHRHPNEEKGKISSITLKKFLTITGDGSSSLFKLITAHERANLYVELLKEKENLDLEKILSKDEELILSVIGNHSKGTQFINGNHLITKELETTFDNLSKSIKGWFYGRIDLKYNNFKEVETGTDFKILEINGIIAEPTHIYDAQNSNYFDALKSIRNHWKYLYNISMINHLQNKIPYKSSKEFINEILDLRAYTKKIKNLSK